VNAESITRSCKQARADSRWHSGKLPRQGPFGRLPSTNSPRLRSGQAGQALRQGLRASRVSGTSAAPLQEPCPLDPSLRSGQEAGATGNLGALRLRSGQAEARPYNTCRPSRQAASGRTHRERPALQHRAQPAGALRLRSGQAEARPYKNRARLTLRSALGKRRALQETWVGALRLRSGQAEARPYKKRARLTLRSALGKLKPAPTRTVPGSLDFAPFGRASGQAGQAGQVQRPYKKRARLTLRSALGKRRALHIDRYRQRASV